MFGKELIPDHSPVLSHFPSSVKGLKCPSLTFMCPSCVPAGGRASDTRAGEPKGPDRRALAPRECFEGASWPLPSVLAVPFVQGPGSSMH